MKLRNKLIPIFSLVAATTVATPIATSCSARTNATAVKTYDVLHGFTPSITRSQELSGLSDLDVQDLYISNIKKNPDILCQDMAWYEGLALNTRANYGKNILFEELEDDYGISSKDIDTRSFLVTPTKAEFGINTPTFNIVEVTNPDTHEKEKVNTITFDVNYTLSYEVTGRFYHSVTRQPVGIKRNYVINFSSSYKNMPFQITRGTMTTLDKMVQSTGLWNFETIGWKQQYRWMLGQIQGWEYKYNILENNVDVFTDLDKNVRTYTDTSSDAQTINSLGQLQSYLDDEETQANLFKYVINFGSYFLYDVYAPEVSIHNLGRSNSCVVSDSDGSFLLGTIECNTQKGNSPMDDSIEHHLNLKGTLLTDSGFDLPILTKDGASQAIKDAAAKVKIRVTNDITIQSMTTSDGSTSTLYFLNGIKLNGTTDAIDALKTALDGHLSYFFDYCYFVLPATKTSGDKTISYTLKITTTQGQQFDVPLVLDHAVQFVWNDYQKLKK